MLSGIVCVSLYRVYHPKCIHNNNHRNARADVQPTTTRRLLCILRVVWNVWNICYGIIVVVVVICLHCSCKCLAVLLFVRVRAWFCCVSSRLRFPVCMLSKRCLHNTWKTALPLCQHTAAVLPWTGLQIEYVCRVCVCVGCTHKNPTSPKAKLFCVFSLFFCKHNICDTYMNDNVHALIYRVCRVRFVVRRRKIIVLHTMQILMYRISTVWCINWSGI